MNYTEENASETARLFAIVQRLDEKHWIRDLGHGWTPGLLLCHLAFWDRATASRLRTWIAGGRLATVPDRESVDAINDSLRNLSRGIGLQEGAKLARECAEEIDTLVSQLNPEQLQELEATGRERWFKRYFHRRDHLPMIERALDS